MLYPAAARTGAYLAAHPRRPGLIPDAVVVHGEGSGASSDGVLTGTGRAAYTAASMSDGRRAADIELASLAFADVPRNLKGACLQTTSPPVMDERDDAAVEESARRIEAIVQGKLVPMRAHYVQERQRVESGIAEYAKVKAFLDVVAEHALADLDTKVDLGCQFFVNAHVPDTKFVCLDIGFGFHAQMTGAEALPFIDDKCRLLRDTAARLSAKADEIQAQIDAVRREMERYAIVRQVEEANRSGRLI